MWLHCEPQHQPLLPPPNKRWLNPAGDKPEPSRFNTKPQTLKHSRVISALKQMSLSRVELLHSEKKPSNPPGSPFVNRLTKSGEAEWRTGSPLLSGTRTGFRWENQTGRWFQLQEQLHVFSSSADLFSSAFLYSNRMERRVHGARRRGCVPRLRALLTEHRGGLNTSVHQTLYDSCQIHTVSLNCSLTFSRLSQYFLFISLKKLFIKNHLCFSMKENLKIQCFIFRGRRKSTWRIFKFLLSYI